MITTSSAADELLRVVLENPFDLQPRLVLADEYEACGMWERAEFIRMNLKSQQKFEFAGRVWLEPALSKNLEIELAVHWARSSEQPWWDCMSYDVVNGFIERIELSCADFMEHAEDIFRQHPVTSVKLSDKSPHIYNRRDRHTDELVGNNPVFEYLSDDIDYSNPSFRGYDNWYLPHAIFEGEFYYRIVDYSEAAINEIVSRRLVIHGRSLAGLPPLVWPSPALAVS